MNIDTFTTAANCTTQRPISIAKLLEIKRKFDAIPKPDYDIVLLTEYQFAQLRYRLEKAVDPVSDCGAMRPWNFSIGGLPYEIVTEDEHGARLMQLRAQYKKVLAFNSDGRVIP